MKSINNMKMEKGKKTKVIFDVICQGDISIEVKVNTSSFSISKMIKILNYTEICIFKTYKTPK